MATYYKYVKAKKIERLVDILTKQRLWASKYMNLKDPMESYFASKNANFVQEWTDGNNNDVRICCLSKTFNYGLMWSMYADEHQGICLEVEIEEDNKIRGKVWERNISRDNWVRCDVIYDSEPNSNKKKLSYH